MRNYHVRTCAICRKEVKRLAFSKKVLPERTTCSCKCAAQLPDFNPKSLEDRFWEKVDKRGPDDCWEWIGAIKSTGRGQFSIGHKIIQAHRMSWILAHGEIHGGLFVCHTCDVGKCVNPNHLFLGTQASNMHDMAAKGRKVTRRGSDDPKAKLTEDQVRQIRHLSETREISQYKIAEMFGVARTTVEAILHRRNWKHLA